MNALSRFVIILLLLYTACSNRREGTLSEQRSLFLQDSLRNVRASDSLRQVALRNRLEEYLKLLDEPSIESSMDESYRVFIEFSWGKSPVGPYLAVHAFKSNGRSQIIIKSLPDSASDRKPRMQKDINETDFQRVATIFNSVDFESQPIVENVEYKVYDADRYIVEQVRNGRYHAISRSDSVDYFVFKFLVESLNLASFDQPELINEFQRHLHVQE